MSDLLVLHMVEVRVELSRQNHLKGSIFMVIQTWVYLVGYNTYLILITAFSFYSISGLDFFYYFTLSYWPYDSQ